MRAIGVQGSVMIETDDSSVVEDEVSDLTSLSSRKRHRNGAFEEYTPPAKKPSHCGPAPFHYEDEAIRTRESVDYSIKITEEMAKNDAAPRPVRVYADGIYDMFHSGHARQLMQAKNCFPNVYLLVGVCDDQLTHSRKGRTVMSESERYEALRHCRYVDEVISSAPWSLDDEYLKEHKIDFVAHDDLPYAASGSEDIYKPLKDKGMFVATQRTEGISTTDVIARIIKDYDMYIRRNLARGYTAKELNLSFMRHKKIQFEDNVAKVKGKGKQFMETIEDKSQGFIQKWEEKSRDFIGNFIDLFGRDGRINQWLSEKRMSVARAISPSRSRSPSPFDFDDLDSPPSKRERRSPHDQSTSGYEDEEEDC